ncbi:MAG: hypothetical protein ABIQ95_13560 [Bdellovibrionia bacterium]
MKQFLLIATLLTFLKVFTAQYVTWDDPVLVINNPLLKLPFLEAIPIFFTSFYHGDYMPLTLISYWVEVALFGYNPLPSHILNFVLHLGCGIALFKFLRSTRLKEGSILLVCAIFLLHPLQVEPVMWISERKGLLSSFLLLVAMVASQKAETKSTKIRGMYLLAYYSLFFGALLTKATGVFIPAFLLWSDVRPRADAGALSFWKAIRKHAVPGLLAALIIMIRISAYKGEVSNLSSFLFEPQRLLQLPLIVSSILGFYLSSFCFPISQSIIYPEFRLDGTLVMRFLTTCAFFIALMGLWKKTRNTEVSFFALFSFVLLLPVLQIVPRLNFVSDRYMYLPIIGIAGLGAIALEQISLRNLKVGFFLTILCLAPLSNFRSGVWADDFHLWSNAVETAPWSGLARNNYAMVLEKQGDVRAAVAEFEKSLTLGKRDGTDNLAYNNLGVLYSRDPKILDQNRAISYFEAGIAEAQRREESYTLRYNLAGSYASIGQIVKAKNILSELEKDLVTATRDKKYLDLLALTQDMIKKIQAQKM